MIFIGGSLRFWPAKKAGLANILLPEPVKPIQGPVQDQLAVRKHSTFMSPPLQTFQPPQSWHQQRKQAIDGYLTTVVEWTDG